MGKGTLMFGLGATRAGSTWLYRYLADHPDCALPRVKELHYFNALDLGGRAFQLRRMDRIIRQAERDIADAPNARRRAAAEARLRDASALRALLDRGEDPAGYVSLLTDGRDGKLFGDITPAYALLSEARLKMMAGLSDAVKFVYLLRDPVDRLWSNIRLAARHKAERGSRTASATAIRREAHNMTDRFFDRDESGLSARSDYAGILTRLRAAVAPENLYLGFYEQLFSQDSIDRLCAFLGIAPRAADFARAANAADKITLSPEHRAAMSRALAPQYDFVETTLGALPERWSQNRIKV